MPYKDRDKARDNARAWARRNPLPKIARSNRFKSLMEQYKNRPCMDCGRTFPTVCMDFDHRDRSNKVTNVAAMKHYSVEKILAEIEKCDLVCASCHRIRTMTREQQTLCASNAPRPKRRYRYEPQH